MLSTESWVAQLLNFHLQWVHRVASLAPVGAIATQRYRAAELARRSWVNHWLLSGACSGCSAPQLCVRDSDCPHAFSKPSRRAVWGKWESLTNHNCLLKNIFIEEFFLQISCKYCSALDGGCKWMFTWVLGAQRYKIAAHAFSAVMVLAWAHLQAERMQNVREALAVCQRS